MTLVVENTRSDEAFVADMASWLLLEWAAAVAAVAPLVYEMAAEHFLNERVSGALLSQNVSEVWKGNKHGNHRFLVLERGLVICKHVTTLSIESSVSIRWSLCCS